MTRPRLYASGVLATALAFAAGAALGWAYESIALFIERTTP